MFCEYWHPNEQQKNFCSKIVTHFWLKSLTIRINLEIYEYNPISVLGAENFSQKKPDKALQGPCGNPNLTSDETQKILIALK